jgi:nucleotide-binding universal stress UspA family protein
MKKLLIPVDGSDNANRAVAHAIERAEAAPGTQIVLLNVQEQLERWYSHGLNSDASRQHLKAAGEQESAQARKLLDDAGCLYEFLITFGKPAEVIARVAKEQACTGIVMGTRGLGDVESVFLGSTAFKVVHLSEIPVTLVK